ncbi:MAG: Ig-like domain-containing protein [Calditrichaeota bacterium]|nr:Ig-like domain-containing protein [Calditrichota bacterium]
MKKSIKIFISLLLITPLWAQFEGIKIMVNPGHGGHDSNDRYIPSTGFWESDGNLTKGLHLRDLLEARGAEVVMSRTQNRTEDDLPLSQIVAIANSNNVDWMHAIHSNAHNANTNYTLILYQGFTNTPTFPETRDMAIIMGKKINETDYTSSYTYAGDFTFYGTGQAYLGVFRGLAMPGTLSEGSFHDYQQESWRLMNLDYRKHEAVALLRSFLEQYDLAPLEYGAVAGLARDKSKLVTYGYNSSLSNDKYTPINNIRVELQKDGQKLRTYNGDFNNNGYFVFDSVDPGSYDLVFDYGQFKSDTLQALVTANKTKFLEVFPDPQTNKEPGVFGTMPDEAADNVNTYSDIKITFSQAMQKDSTQAAISINPVMNGSFSWSDNNTILMFRPEKAFMPGTNYQVSVGTGAQNNSGINISQTFQFTFSTAADHVYPKIVETFPAENDSIVTDKSIVFTFDQQMIPDSAEYAFQIEPAINGKFTWSENNTVCTFDPDSLLSADTPFSLAFSPKALNTYHVGLESEFVLNFKTRKRNHIHVVKSFPAQGDSGISTMAEYYFEFDGLVDGNTVIGNVEMWAEDNSQIALKSYKLEARGNHGVLRFETRSEIEKNRTYSIQLLPQIRDIEELPLVDTLIYSFNTTKKTYIEGNVLDNFDTESGWQDPNSGGASAGIDETSSFGLSALKKISGATSGKLFYVFSDDSAGICQVSRFDPYMFNTPDSSRLGIWVYGDYSFNTLELWFDVNGQSNKPILLDTLNFSGWKMLQIPAAVIGSGEKSLTSIVIRQQKEGYPEGTIYFEDIQYGVITGFSSADENKIADNFNLYQNYPNPFNPATTIKFNLKEASDVKLSIYNTLGQEVETVFEGKQAAGLVTTVWNASQYASGIYYYRLEAKTSSGKQFSAIRKLLLLK